MLRPLQHLMMLCALGVSHTTHAQEITLKVHHFLSSASPAHAKFITPWCGKIEKEFDSPVLHTVRGAGYMLKAG